MPHPLTILQATGSISAAQGGPSRSVTTLCSALVGDGARVRLVVPDYQGTEGPDILPESPDVEIRRVRPFTLKRLRFYHAFGMRRLLIREIRHADVIHSHGLWLGINHDMAVAAKVGRRPHVVSPRGMLQPWARHHSGIRKGMAWWAFQGSDLRRAQAFHATSRHEYESIRNAGLRQPVAIIPNAITMPPEGDAPARSSDAPRHALFLSRLHPVKGLSELLKAWHVVAAGKKGWRLTIAGPDEVGILGSLRDLAKSLDIDSSVDFRGAASAQEKWTLYRSADLFVLPTFSENFGIVIAEALAAGVPVVTTKGAPWAGLVTERCGWWSEVGVESFAKALSEAIEAPSEQLREMGRRGRNWIVQEYSSAHIGRKMHDFYRWLVSGGPTPNWVSP